VSCWAQLQGDVPTKPVATVASDIVARVLFLTIVKYKTVTGYQKLTVDALQSLTADVRCSTENVVGGMMMMMIITDEDLKLCQKKK
jgi:hypothetical protein